ncbi:uncharacterized deoxyribonuclease YMR262W [Trichomonascus vanleenenianus]|uniref:putative endodeoxyribonuclease n=1 Tax=Trichomonascus vanleenenianus TaxID=2268995 RepID=UPI003ECB445C
MKTSKLVTMATRLNDVDRVAEIAQKYPSKVIPAYGYHPWFSHLVYVGEKPQNKLAHYTEVLYPEPTEEFVEGLPDPTSWEEHLDKIRRFLEADSRAIVGEIGLDKAFRLPVPGSKLSPYKVSMEHQKRIFQSLLDVASELKRPCSIHSVQCHNTMFEQIKAMKVPPPSICLHSYTGSPDFVKSAWLTKKAPKCAVYFSGSVLINISTQEKSDKIFSTVPADRVLTESDYHAAGDEMDQYIEQSLHRICASYGWDTPSGARIMLDNFRRFIEP